MTQICSWHNCLHSSSIKPAEPAICTTFSSTDRWRGILTYHLYSPTNHSNYTLFTLRWNQKRTLNILLPEQTICRPIKDSRSRPTAQSFKVQTQYSNVSESNKYIFTIPVFKIQTSDRISPYCHVYVCVCVCEHNPRKPCIQTCVVIFLNQDYKKEM